jgi:hypothetical protein
MPREPALAASEGRMPRARPPSSERRAAGTDPSKRIGRRSERPATGRGQPRTVGNGMVLPVVCFAIINEGDRAWLTLVR